MIKDLTLDYVKSKMPVRPDDANKGVMGTMLNISGSYAMAGACILSSLSALKSGVGLLKVALPQSIYPIVASSVYEAVFVPVSEKDADTVDISSLDYLLNISKSANSVLLGCGLKCCEKTVEFVNAFLPACTTPVLLDADGINGVSKNIDILKSVENDVILTPHPKEFSRLTKLSVEEILSDREGVAKAFAKEYGVTLVIKGKDTIITNGEQTFVNHTGNSGMAKGGSGDVLSGIIASLVAQKVDAFDAACLGVFVHGLAGDLAAEKLSKTAMLPSDIISYLPQAYKKIEE